jgi:hypothetical protein
VPLQPCVSWVEGRAAGQRSEPVDRASSSYGSSSDYCAGPEVPKLGEQVADLAIIIPDKMGVNGCRCQRRVTCRVPNLDDTPVTM